MIPNGITILFLIIVGALAVALIALGTLAGHLLGW